MAVQKSKLTRSRTNKRRAHDSLSATVLSKDKTTGEVQRRHHVTTDGFFKGKMVLDLAEE